MNSLLWTELVNHVSIRQRYDGTYRLLGTVERLICWWYCGSWRGRVWWRSACRLVGRIGSPMEKGLVLECWWHLPRGWVQREVSLFDLELSSSVVQWKKRAQRLKRSVAVPTKIEAVSLDFYDAHVDAWWNEIAVPSIGMIWLPFHFWWDLV